MKKRSTIIDVAKAAGVSPSTVSRVLNSRLGGVPISEQTRQSVKEAAQKLGYEASVFAAALRTERTGVIGAVIRDVRDPFLSLLLQEIQEVAYQVGKEVLIGHAKYDIVRAERFLRLMRGRLFDGVILMGDMPGDASIIDELSQYATPYVTIARGTKAATPSVNVDEALGTQLALSYLLELGHRRIACMAALPLAGVGERVTEYHQFIATHSLPWHDRYLQTGHLTQVAVQWALQTMLSAPEPPTAIFCATDRMAIHVISASRSLGLRLPDELSIIGFDDIDDAAQTFPALTTIRQPVTMMAQAAIDILLECLEAPASAKERLRAKRQILPPALIIRDSCSIAASMN